MTALLKIIWFAARALGPTIVNIAIEELGPVCARIGLRKFARWLEDRFLGPAAFA